MLGDLDRLLAARGGDSVDVVDALANVETAGLHGRFVRDWIANEVDVAVRAPHRPVAVVVLVAEQLRVGVIGAIRNPQIRGVRTPIVLPRPDSRMPIEGELLAVRRIRAPE